MQKKGRQQHWLTAYNKSNLRGDLAAGITVGILLIPQGMAYAMLAGLPPVHGLYAALIPIVIYAFLGSSRQLAIGPVAMDALLTAAGVSALNPQSTSEYILYASALACMAGILQLVMGVFRLGFLVNFLSTPVVKGFTWAAAVIIGLSQLKHLLRIPVQSSNYIQEIVPSLVRTVSALHLPSLVLGILAIALLVFMPRFSKRLPIPVLLVVVSVLGVWVSGADTRFNIQIMGTIPDGLPSFTVPRFNWDVWQQMLPAAITIAVVGFMESYAIGKTMQVKHNDHQVSGNRELIALGFSNIGAALFQAFPVAGGFSRTAVNDRVGAKTQLAALISALLVLLTLLFLTPLFYYLPQPVLAALIIVAVAGLISWKDALVLWRKDRADFWMLLATLIGTLVLGINWGIALGVLLSLGMLIYRASRPHMAELGRVPGTHWFRNKERFPNAQLRPDVLFIRMDGPLYFANLTYFKENLDAMVDRKGLFLNVIVVNGEAISHIDSSAVQSVKEWIQSYQARNIQVYFVGLIGPVRDAFARWELVDFIGKDHFFMSNEQALDYYDSLHTQKPTSLSPDPKTETLESYILQNNVTDEKD